MAENRQRHDHRFERNTGPTMRNWKELDEPTAREIDRDVILPCGWGRLLFGHTFRHNEDLARELLKETAGERDIAFYLRDPHVVLSFAPDKLFLDPSHTYRMWLSNYKPGRERRKARIAIHRVRSREDAHATADVYAKRRMVVPDENFLFAKRNSRSLSYFLARDAETDQILGTIMGVDHVHAFHDPENGASFWCLAVDPDATQPGVGEALVRHVLEYYQARERSFVDLSVMHDNEQAIALYDKLGFQRVPVFAVKRKNPINEPLFTPTEKLTGLNPYARLITDEAQRRGIAVEMVDPEAGHFKLSFGGRSVTCWESLTDLTSAMAFLRCDDKALTRRTLSRAGLRMPAQALAGDPEDNAAFLKKYERVVVKPRQGEQGVGVFVDLDSPGDVERAVAQCREVCEHVLLEEYVPGEDLRIIVIDHRTVAAAVRKPARIIGTGEHTIEELIEKQSRRRAAATGGESAIPLDEETGRCVRLAGYSMDDVLPAEEELTVRKTANLHTGGTIHDVTPILNPVLAEAAERASRALEIPVVGFDLMVPDVEGEQYAIIEANERAGLANHEPQPTAERFIDLLFPQTVPAWE